MPNEAKIQSALADILAPGERVESALVCQVKGGQKAQLSAAAASAAVSSAVSLAAQALGASTGVLAVRVPPAVWVVITDLRLLMFPREGINNTVRSIGNLTFAAPRSALRAELKSGLLSTVGLLDAADGQTLLTLRFGARKSAARRVADACTG
jgi:hypothetical protein